MNKKYDSVGEAFVVEFVSAVAIVFWGAYALMILIGNLHASILPQMPTIGYMKALWVTVPVMSLVTAIKLYSKDDK
jgi:hypothetical protein